MCRPCRYRASPVTASFFPDAPHIPSIRPNPARDIALGPSRTHQQTMRGEAGRWLVGGNKETQAALPRNTRLPYLLRRRGTRSQRGRTRLSPLSAAGDAQPRPQDAQDAQDAHSRRKEGSKGSKPTDTPFRARTPKDTEHLTLLTPSSSAVWPRHHNRQHHHHQRRRPLTDLAWLSGPTDHGWIDQTATTIHVASGNCGGTHATDSVHGALTRVQCGMRCGCFIPIATL